VSNIEFESGLYACFFCWHNKYLFSFSFSYVMMCNVMSLKVTKYHVEFCLSLLYY